MKITVKVDEDLCIGAASCITIDPATFVLNDENKAYVLDHGKAEGGDKYEREMEVTQDELDNIILAAQSCPTLAVIVLDADGEQLYPEL